jgi:hypothetical protein
VRCRPGTRVARENRPHENASQDNEDDATEHVFAL